MFVHTYLIVDIRFWIGTNWDNWSFVFWFQGYEKKNLGNCLMKICINHISFSPSTSTIISYFGFLLASIIFTLVLFISSSKIQLIWNEGRGNPLSSLFSFQQFCWFSLYQFMIIEIHIKFRVLSRIAIIPTYSVESKWLRLCHPELF